MFNRTFTYSLTVTFVVKLTNEMPEKNQVPTNSTDFTVACLYINVCFCGTPVIAATLFSVCDEHL